MLIEEKRKKLNDNWVEQECARKTKLKRVKERLGGGWLP